MSLYLVLYGATATTTMVPHCKMLIRQPYLEKMRLCSHYIIWAHYFTLLLIPSCDCCCCSGISFLSVQQQHGKLTFIYCSCTCWVYHKFTLARLLPQCPAKGVKCIEK